MTIHYHAYQLTNIARITAHQGAMTVPLLLELLVAPDEYPLEMECEEDVCFLPPPPTPPSPSLGRSLHSLRSFFSGVGPDVDVVAPRGRTPMGRCILAAASGSPRCKPCLLYVSRRCDLMACAEGSLTAIQLLTWRIQPVLEDWPLLLVGAVGL